MSIISSAYPTRDWTETAPCDGTLGRADIDVRHQQTSVSFIDWDHIATQLGVSLTPLLRPDAEHLLPDTHLRAHLVDALLHAGVHPHEICLDAIHHPAHDPRVRARCRGVRRVELCVDLDMGISIAIAVTHPWIQLGVATRPRMSGHRVGAGWTRSLQRAAVHPVHEHIAVALLTDTDCTHLAHRVSCAGLTWPARGQTITLERHHVGVIAGDAAQRTWPGAVDTTCLCAHQLGTHQLMVFHTHQLLDQFPAPTNPSGIS